MTQSEKPSLGQIKTMTPDYNPRTMVFSQVMDFRSPHRLDGEAAGVVMMRGAEVFKGVLVMNGFDDHAWPPDDVAMDPHADAMGAVMTFKTRAKRTEKTNRAARRAAH